MLTSIRNALAVKHSVASVPFSNLKYEIAKILEKNGFIAKVEKKGKKIKKLLEITLKYDKGTSVISDLKRISKLSQRIYKKAEEMKPVKGGYGIAIISTSKGLMTDKEARKQKMGGEVICEVW